MYEIKDVAEKVARNKNNNMQIVCQRKTAKGILNIRYYQVESGAICALLQPDWLLLTPQDVDQLRFSLDFNDIDDNNIFIAQYDNNSNTMKFWRIIYLKEYLLNL